jgi:tripartite-type tricarboxylate transporter receptor subunit TctC
LLHGEIKVMELPAVKVRMAVLGFEPVANTPEEFAARIKFEIPKWTRREYQGGAVNWRLR